MKSSEQPSDERLGKENSSEGEMNCREHLQKADEKQREFQKNAAPGSAVGIPVCGD